MCTIVPIYYTVFNYYELYIIIIIYIIILKIAHTKISLISIMHYENLDILASVWT